MKKISQKKIFYWGAFFILLFFACRKATIEEIYVYKTEKNWIHQNGGIYNHEKLFFKTKEGNLREGSLNWSNANRFIYSGIEYLEIPFSFNEKSGNVKALDKSSNLLFSMVLRIVDKKIEAAIKITQWGALLKNKNGDKLGILETYYKLDGTWINTWFRDRKTGRLMKREGNVIANNIKTLSTTSIPNIKPSTVEVQCDIYTYAYQEYHCWPTDQNNPSYDTSCGWITMGYIDVMFCYDLGGGGGSATTYPPSGGGSTPNSPPPSPDCATFDNKVKNILNFEGGYTNDPNDPGGPTNKGIIWKEWVANAQSLLGVEPTLQNLQNITDDQAKAIYKALYWTPIHADEIIDGDLRYMLFDFYVNAGGNAIKVLQKTINQLGGAITVDGVMGQQTLDAINSVDVIALYNTFKTNRQGYYNNLAARSSKLATFLRGWTNRVNAFINKTIHNYLNVNC